MKVLVKSGELLTIEYRDTNKVYLSGNVKNIFKGKAIIIY